MWYLILYVREEQLALYSNGHSLWTVREFIYG